MATEFISNSWLMPTNANAEANRVSNYSLDFDGSSQYIDLGNVYDSIFTSSNFTVSTWIYSTGNTSYDNFFNKGTTVQFYLVSNKIQIYFSPSSIGIYPLSSIATLSLNTWYNIVFTRSGNENKLYINGTLDNSATSTGSISSSTGSLTFSSYSGGSSYFWEGKLTEYSIFDYALSASQVTELYGTGSAIGNPMSLTTKPVAYYPLGNAAFNGEFLATNNATELYENYALDFDGTDDYIDCGNVLDQTGTDAFSVSGWLKYDTTKSNTLVGKMNSSFVGYQIYINAANKLKFLLQGTGNLSATGVTALSTNNWYHIVITYDGTGATSGINFYINGTSETFTGSGSNSGGVSNSENFEIGARTGTTDALDGSISNVSIYNLELSAAQVTTLYNSGKPFDLNTFAITPVSWWRLGAVNSSFDGTNWTVLDEISTSGNNGVSANMTQSDLVSGVGATGSGTSSGMSSGTNRTGDAPYSESNTVSYNLSVTAKSTSVPT